MASDALDDFLSRFARFIDDIRQRGEADRWRLPPQALGLTLHRSVVAWGASLGRNPSTTEIEAYLRAIHAEDLVLACACQHGLEPAWEHFISRHRSGLYAAAHALVHDQVHARELADSLYAELFGLDDRDGTRRSLFQYFHGRSSLKTWLRAVLAQRHTDAFRVSRRFEPLSEEAERELVAAQSASDPPDPDRERYVRSLAEALRNALRELTPRDRIRLRHHYVDELTLKEIGRLMDEHESTVSRKIARTRRQLRKRVERTLRREQHLSDEQIRLCYDYAVEAWTPDLRQLLSEPQ
jgi:RNA polymerase sigma-70 factor, ECF subfamily